MRYRPNVALILEDPTGNILIGERLDNPGSWQFPQGGAKAKETPSEALAREGKEELGLSPKHYIVTQQKSPYRYLFRKGRKKEGFDGQEQTYFRARFLKAPSTLNGPIDSPEFSQVRWIAPIEFQLDWVPDFKKDVYRQVFRDFFNVEL